jgi:hypothetical protein
MNDDALSPAEELVMKQTFKATMLRAAAIIDRITKDDVTDAQLSLYREGVGLLELHRVDRAMLASAHLRSCAEMGDAAQATTTDLRRLLGAK